MGGINEFIGELEQFDSELTEFNQILKKNVRDAVRKATRDVKNEAVRRAPEDTGALKDSASHWVEGYEGFIEFDTPYAAAQEYGSGIAYWGKPYSITPNEKEALKFTVNGKTIFAKSVVHPGVKAQPYLRPAIKRKKHAFKDHLEEGLQEALEEVF
jgi:hypothetical protein